MNNQKTPLHYNLILLFDSTVISNVTVNVLKHLIVHFMLYLQSFLANSLYSEDNRKYVHSYKILKVIPAGWSISFVGCPSRRLRQNNRSARPTTLLKDSRNIVFVGVAAR